MPNETDPCRPGASGAPGLSSDDAVATARVLKALADPVRLQLVSLISSHEGGEACVCDLTGAFDLTAPTISHHLKVLREAGLLTSERRGTWVHYRVVRPAMEALAAQVSDLHAPPLSPPLVSAAAQQG